MAQVTNVPGYPANFQANLPVATNAQIAIPGRQPVSGLVATVFNGKTYSWKGAQ